MSYSLKAASARDGIASPPPPATAIPALSDRRRTEEGDRGMTAGSDLERGIPIRSISRAIAVLQAINRGGSITMMEIARASARSEEHKSELQTLMRITYAVFCLKKNE